MIEEERGAFVGEMSDNGSSLDQAPEGCQSQRF